MQLLDKIEKKEKKVKEAKQNIFQKDLNPKEVLIAVGISGAVFAYGFLFVYPKYTEYKATVSNLESIETNIATYEDKMNLMPQKESELNSLQRELKIKSKMLSHNMEDGMFLIGLSKLMKDVSVDLVDYTVDEEIPFETFYGVPTSITVRGNYRHIREIMYYLEEQKNMTQILDYSMEEHIPEDKSEVSRSGSEVLGILPNDTVYWTTSGNAYHKEDCVVLGDEKSKSEGNVLSGSSAQSEKGAACQACKPYTLEQSSSQPQDVEPEKPKSNGTIEATFKFMMYSANDPKLELNNDDISNWKPGKFNPFTTTTR